MLKQTIRIACGISLCCLLACGTQKTLSTNTTAPITQLCGLYVTNKALLDSVNFISWNRAEAMLEYIPPSHYFITHDTLVILPDKSFFMYQISPDRKTLKGIGGWADKSTLKLVSEPEGGCPSYQLTEADERWLDLEKRYHQVVLQGSWDTQLAIAEAFCEAGHTKSCINLAYANLLDADITTGTVPEPDSIPLIRAGELGDYMGYWRLGESMERTKQYARAKHYFAKSCAMKHQASCMMLEMMDLIEERE